MGYGLTDLHNIVMYIARQAKDGSEYVPTQIDYALQRGGQEWVRTTKATRRLDPLNLTAGSNDLPSFPSGFKPEYLMRAYLTLSGHIIKPDITVISYDRLLDKMYRDTTSTSAQLPSGRPRYIGYSTTTTGKVGPEIPDQNYVLNLWWFSPFTSWTAGVDPTTVTSFNLPDDHLHMIAVGAAGFMQLQEKENAAAAQANIAEFRNAAKQFRSLGSGGTGEQVIERSAPDWKRGC